MKPCKNDDHKAFCVACRKEFKIDKRGEIQVNSHAKRDSRISNVIGFGNQSTFQVLVGTLGVTKGSGGNLSAEDMTLQAEILNLLHVVEYNLPFSSCSENPSRFQLMFPDSAVGKKYSCSSTKVAYLLNKIYLKLLSHINLMTTNQVKKQYVAYLSYWSLREGKIVNKYCGSNFIGHCSFEDLLVHFMNFVREFSLDSNYLLHVGMDGPSVNIAIIK